MPLFRRKGRSAELGQGEIVKLAETIASPKSGPAKQGEAVRTLLPHLEAPEARNALAGLMQHPDRDVRRAVAANFVHARGPGALELLSLGARDGDNYVRVCAARGLGQLGEPGAAPLMELAADPDPAARADAAWGVQELGGATGMVALAELLRDSDARVRTAAAKAVGHGVTSLLVPGSVREKPSPEVVSTLKQVAESDPDESVRYEATVALAKLVGEAPPPPPPKAVADAPPQFRAAIRVLDEAYLTHVDEDLERRVAEALNSIVDEGDAGVAFLVDQLYRDMRIEGGRLTHGPWGDDAWNLWLQKREIVRSLDRAGAQRAITRLRPLLEIDSTDPQFHQILRPAISEMVTRSTDTLPPAAPKAATRRCCICGTDLSAAPAMVDRLTGKAYCQEHASLMS